MALLTKTKERVLQAHPYRAGRVPIEFLKNGFINAWENVQGHGVKAPDLTIGNVTAQTSTPSAAFVTGTGRAYGLQITSPVGASNAVIVQLTDNNIVIASVKCEAAASCEVYFGGDTDGIGIAFGTNLKVLAVQAADGASNPAAGDRPSVVVLYGDDTVNSDQSNLLVTSFG